MILDARDIEAGKCWRKLTGRFAYLAISEGSKSCFQLDPDKLYGISFNGNMTSVDFGTKVVLVSPSAMLVNREDYAAGLLGVFPTCDNPDPKVVEEFIDDSDDWTKSPT